MLIVMSKDDSYCWFSKGSAAMRHMRLSNIVESKAPWRDKHVSHLVFMLMCNPHIPFLLCFVSANWVNGMKHHERLFYHPKQEKTLDSSGTWYSQKYKDGIHGLFFFPALLQLQDVYFRPFHKYKASQLTGISTVGKGGSSKGDGSGMWFLGVKSSCLKTVKTSMM